MENSLIPSKFTLGGSEYNVEYVDPKMGKTVGMFDSIEGKVYIATAFEGRECSKDYMEASFFHELIHGMFDHTGKTSLSADEELVEGLSHMLHQYMKTKVN
jgi:uncharacterized membrane protein